MFRGSSLGTGSATCSRSRGKVSTLSFELLFSHHLTRSGQFIIRLSEKKRLGHRTLISKDITARLLSNKFCILLQRFENFYRCLIKRETTNP